MPPEFRRLANRQQRAQLHRDAGTHRVERQADHRPVGVRINARSGAGVGQGLPRVQPDHSDRRKALGPVLGRTCLSDHMRGPVRHHRLPRSLSEGRCRHVGGRQQGRPPKATAATRSGAASSGPVPTVSSNGPRLIGSPQGDTSLPMTTQAIGSVWIFCLRSLWLASSQKSLTSGGASCGGPPRGCS